MDIQDETQKNCKELNKILTLESQLKPFSQNKQNVFVWPIQPEKGLSAYFRDASYLSAVGSSHDAIDIVAPQGTDIVAPADGYITYLKEPKDE
jgi:murein DD-endopeptidase MepM/ murein hydrolase activator NlpD